MINSILNRESKTIFGAAFILGAASLVSRLLGVMRDRVLAGRFGAGDELDIYYAAFRIPDLVFALFALGAISAGFIPVFVGYLKNNRDKAWYLANSILNFIGLSTGLVCLILSFLSPWLMKFVAPGFDHDKISLTIQLSRIMFLSPVFLSLSAVFGGILQSFKKFLAYSLAPIFYNLGIILGAIFFVDYFGLVGLAYGVILGAFLHMILQMTVVLLCGFKWLPKLDFKFIGFRRVLKLMPYRVLSLILTQINIWAVTVFASYLAIGSVAVYNLAYNIWSFPFGILGISFSVAAFPRLSEAAQNNDKRKFRKVFIKTFRQILFFTLLATALFIFLRLEIIEVVLGTGNFSEEAVQLTALTMSYLMISLFAESLILLVLRGFFAWEDAKTPFLIGCTITILRLYLAYYLSKSFGLPGLALGFSLGGIMYFIVLFVLLAWKNNFWAFLHLMFMPVLKICIVFFLTIILLIPIISFSRQFVGDNTVMILTYGCLIGVIASIIYFFLSWVFKLEESRLLLKFVDHFRKAV